MILTQAGGRVAGARRRTRGDDDPTHWKGRSTGHRPAAGHWEARQV